jgi:hypothetical protein
MFVGDTLVINEPPFWPKLNWHMAGKPGLLRKPIQLPIAVVEWLAEDVRSLCKCSRISFTHRAPRRQERLA